VSWLLHFPSGGLISLVSSGTDLMSLDQVNGLQLIHHASSVDGDMKEDVTVG